MQQGGACKAFDGVVLDLEAASVNHAVIEDVTNTLIMREKDSMAAHEGRLDNRPEKAGMKKPVCINAKPQIADCFPVSSARQLASEPITMERPLILTSSMEREHASRSSHVADTISHGGIQEMSEADSQQLDEPFFPPDIEWLGLGDTVSSADTGTTRVPANRGSRISTYPCSADSDANSVPTHRREGRRLDKRGMRSLHISSPASRRHAIRSSWASALRRGIKYCSGDSPTICAQHQILDHRLLNVLERSVCPVMLVQQTEGRAVSADDMGVQDDYLAKDVRGGAFSHSTDFKSQLFPVSGAQPSPPSRIAGVNASALHLLFDANHPSDVPHEFDSLFRCYEFSIFKHSQWTEVAAFQSPVGHQSPLLPGTSPTTPAPQPIHVQDLLADRGERCISLHNIKDGSLYAVFVTTLSQWFRWEGCTEAGECVEHLEMGLCGGESLNAVGPSRTLVFFFLQMVTPEVVAGRLAMGMVEKKGSSSPLTTDLRGRNATEWDLPVLSSPSEHTYTRVPRQHGNTVRTTCRAAPQTPLKSMRIRAPEVVTGIRPLHVCNFSHARQKTPFAEERPHTAESPPELNASFSPALISPEAFSHVFIHGKREISGSGISSPNAFTVPTCGVHSVAGCPLVGAGSQSPHPGMLTFNRSDDSFTPPLHSTTENGDCTAHSYPGLHKGTPFDSNPPSVHLREVPPAVQSLNSHRRRWNPKNSLSRPHKSNRCAVKAYCPSRCVFPLPSFWVRGSLSTFPPCSGVPSGSSGHGSPTSSLLGAHISPQRGHAVDNVSSAMLRHALVTLKDISDVVVSDAVPSRLLVNFMALMMFIQEVLQHYREEGAGSIVSFVAVSGTSITLDLIPRCHLLGTPLSVKMKELETRNLEREQTAVFNSSAPEHPHHPLCEGQTTQLRMMDAVTHALSPLQGSSPNWSTNAFLAAFPHCSVAKLPIVDDNIFPGVADDGDDEPLEFCLNPTMLEYLRVCDGSFRYARSGTTLVFPFITSERLKLLNNIPAVQLSTPKGLSLFGVSMANALTKEVAKTAPAATTSVIPLRYGDPSQEFRHVLETGAHVQIPGHDGCASTGESFAAVAVTSTFGPGIPSEIYGADRTEGNNSTVQMDGFCPGDTGAAGQPIQAAHTVSNPLLSHKCDRGSGSLTCDIIEKPLMRRTMSCPLIKDDLTSLVYERYQTAASFSGSVVVHLHQKCREAKVIEEGRHSQSDIISLDQFINRTSGVGCSSSSKADEVSDCTTKTTTSCFLRRYNSRNGNSEKATDQGFIRCINGSTPLSLKLPTALPRNTLLRPNMGWALSGVSCTGKPESTYMAADSFDDSFTASLSRPDVLLCRAVRSSTEVGCLETRDGGSDAGDKALYSRCKQRYHVLVVNEVMRPDVEDILAASGHAVTFATTPDKLRRYLAVGLSSFDVTLVHWDRNLITDDLMQSLKQRSNKASVILFFVQGGCTLPVPPDVGEEAIIRADDIAQVVRKMCSRSHVRSYIHFNLLLHGMVEVRVDRSYQIVRRIGSGAFADVFEVLQYVSKGRLAMKRVFLSHLSKRVMDQLNREVVIMESLDHPNIVSFSHSMKEGDAYCIFMELCEGNLQQRLSVCQSSAPSGKHGSSAFMGGGSTTVRSGIGGGYAAPVLGAGGSATEATGVNSFIRSLTAWPSVRISGSGAVNGGCGKLVLTPREAVFIVRDIAKGLAYLHSKGVIHRDIKPDNILFLEGVAKIGDFGSAVMESERVPLTNMKGTLAYMSPEVLLGEPYGKPCDMWSFGCLLTDVLGIHLGHLHGLHIPALMDFYRSIPPDETLPVTIDCSRRDGNNFLPATVSNEVLAAMRTASTIARTERQRAKTFPTIGSRSGSELRCSSATAQGTFPSKVPSSSESSKDAQERTVTCISLADSMSVNTYTTALPSTLVELLEALFHRNPRERMTVEELLNHPVSWDVKWMASMMHAVQQVSRQQSSALGSITLDDASGVLWPVTSRQQDIQPASQPISVPRRPKKNYGDYMNLSVSSVKEGVPCLP